MSSFFEPPPPPPEPEPPPELPDWFGPPQGTLPGVVALELVLARSEIAAVCITRLAAYPNGFEFDVVTLTAPGQEYELDPMLFGPHRHHRRQRRDEGIAGEILRLGVEFADGSKATNLQGRAGPDEQPEGPLLMDRGGGGGGGEWRQSEWVWPLPPPGRLSFVCEWPAAGIELTREEIDAQIVLDAAERARAIFGGPRPDRPGGRWSSFGALAFSRPQAATGPAPEPPPARPAPPPSGS